MRSLKSIVEEYLLYGYDPDEIAELENIKINTVWSYQRKALLRIDFIHQQRLRNWMNWEKKPEHDHEDKYGKQPLPTYNWNELEFEEKRLYFRDEHDEMMESIRFHYDENEKTRVD